MKNTKSFVLREAELPAMSVLRLGLHFLQIRIRFVLFLGKKGLTESLHDSSIESILLRRKIKKR